MQPTAEKREREKEKHNVKGEFYIDLKTTFRRGKS